MSKSRGNTVDPFDLFDKYGADVLRWYLIYVSPPWTPTRFDEDGLREVESKFFRSIKKMYIISFPYMPIQMKWIQGISLLNMKIDQK